MVGVQQCVWVVTLWEVQQCVVGVQQCVWVVTWWEVQQCLSGEETCLETAGGRLASSSVACSSVSVTGRDQVCLTAAC